MEIIVTQFKADILQNEQTGCHSNGQTKNINKRKNFVLEQVSQGSLQIIFEHGLKIKL
jgi:hypothetical protein